MIVLFVKISGFYRVTHDSLYYTNKVKEMVSEGNKNEE